MRYQLQIFDFAVKKSLMNISQLTVSSFEGPFLPRVEISQSYIIYDNVLNKRIPE